MVMRAYSAVDQFNFERKKKQIDLLQMLPVSPTSPAPTTTNTSSGSKSALQVSPQSQAPFGATAPVVPQKIKNTDKLASNSAPPAQTLELLTLEYNGVRFVVPFFAGDAEVVFFSPHGVDRGTHLHAGIDLAAPTGTRIVLPVAGTVEAVIDEKANGGPGKGYGNQIDVRLPDGTLLRFAHLNASYVEEGQVLPEGTVLGEVGSTGHSTGPHLHFEVRPPGADAYGYANADGYPNTRNPVSWLAGLGNSEVPVLVADGGASAKRQAAPVLPVKKVFPHTPSALIGLGDVFAKDATVPGTFVNDLASYVPSPVLPKVVLALPSGQVDLTPEKTKQDDPEKELLNGTPITRVIDLLTPLLDRDPGKNGNYYELPEKQRTDFEPESISLPAALARLEETARIRNAKIEVEIAQAQLDLVQAQNNPFTGQVQVALGQISSSPAALLGGRVELAYTPFDSGARDASMEAARKNVEIANYKLKQVQRDETYILKVQYNKVLLAQGGVDSNRTYFKDAKNNLDKISKLFQGNSVAPFEVAQAQLAFDGAKKEYEAALSNLQRQELELSRLLATPKGITFFTAKGDLTKIAVWNLPLEETQNLALNNNPSVAVFTEEAKRREFLAQAAQAAGGVKVSVRGSIANGWNGFGTEASLAVVATVPLSNQTAQANAAVNRAQADQAQSKADDTRQTISKNIGVAWDRLRSLGRDITGLARFDVYLLSNRENGKLNDDLTQVSVRGVANIVAVSVEAGVRKPQDLLVAQKEGKQAQENLNTLVFQYRETLADLERLTGVGLAP